jgi:hypothetical protein
MKFSTSAIIVGVILSVAKSADAAVKLVGVSRASVPNGFDAASSYQNDLLNQVIDNDKSGLVETSYNEDEYDHTKYCELAKTDGFTRLNTIEEFLGVANDAVLVGDCGNRQKAPDGCYWNVKELLTMHYDAGISM